MNSVGDGVREIRIRLGAEHRLLYVASFPEAVFILHAFEKKTEKTVRSDINLARIRYRTVRARRAGKSPLEACS